MGSVYLEYFYVGDINLSSTLETLKAFCKFEYKEIFGVDFSMQKLLMNIECYCKDFPTPLAIKTSIILNIQWFSSAASAEAKAELESSPLYSLIASSSSVFPVLLLVEADESLDELLIGSDDGLCIF